MAAGLVSVALLEKLTPGNVSMIIFGAVLNWFSMVLGTWSYQTERFDKLESQLESTQHAMGDARQTAKQMDSILSILKIHADAISNIWFIEAIRHLNALITDANRSRRHHAIPYMQQEFARLTKELFNRYFVLPFEQKFDIQTEAERMKCLVNVVSNSRVYVRAATFDVDDYFMKFWNSSDPLFGAYLETNEKAVKRGVLINRCFVMNRDVLDGRNEKKRDRLVDILIKHRAFGPSCVVKVHCMDDLPADLEGAHRSFLICDDHFTSESYCKGDSRNTGYIKIDDDSNSAYLYDRFLKLDILPDYASQLISSKLKHRSPKQK
jgi:hypothetical protein